MGVASERLITVHQIHSARAVTVGDTRPDPRPQADALVTASPAPPSPC